jgi:hypothetical protein
MYRRFPTSAECDIQTEQLAPNAKYPASGHHGRAHIGLQFLVSRDGFGNDRASFLDRLTAFRSADSRSSKTLPLFNERNWPMLFLTRCGLAIIRWLLNAGMLMLIILLLFMDTPDRRPFVQSLALGVVAVVESDWAKDFIPADPGADSIKEPSEPEPEQFEPWDLIVTHKFGVFDCQAARCETYAMPRRSPSSAASRSTSSSDQEAHHAFSPSGRQALRSSRPSCPSLVPSWAVPPFRQSCRRSSIRLPSARRHKAYQGTSVPTSSRTAPAKR